MSGARAEHQNNFDFLRLLFALIVVMAHAGRLSGSEDLRALQDFFSFRMAVQGFFVISGYLIFMSYENSTLRSYIEKRIRRIYPALFMVVVLTALLGVFLSSLPPEAYFASKGFWHFLLANLSFFNYLGHDLPGVFASQSHPYSTVNGSLWTL
nr:acyltransferase family protein [Alphaproteobacteria bacterium]